jgi:hypothetical protein
MPQCREAVVPHGQLSSAAKHEKARKPLSLLSRSTPSSADWLSLHRLLMTAALGAKPQLKLC